MTKQESAQQTASLGSPALGFATSLDDDPMLDPFAHLFKTDATNAPPAEAANAPPADVTNALFVESAISHSVESALAPSAEAERTFADDARATSQSHSPFDSEGDFSLGTRSPAPSGIYSLGIRTSSGELQQIRQQGLRTTILPRLQKSSDSAAPQLVIDGQERYQNKRSLGSGAMGEVDLAFDKDIQRMVAIKRLKSELHTTAPVVRFAEEVRIVGQLEHPNIVPIHDVGLDKDGCYYFVMKYVQGETLEDIIDKLRSGDTAYHARFPLTQRLQILIDILKAIDFAHDQGILHRDLKPANIMIGPHFEVLVMDWGIAKRINMPAPSNTPSPSQFVAAQTSKTAAASQTSKTAAASQTAAASAASQVSQTAETSKTAAKADLMDELARALEQDRKHLSEQLHLQTQNNRLIGTPMYMSPEQALGLNDRIDTRSDLYSLCVVFYEFLSLQHYLSNKESLFEILFAVAKEEPRSVFILRHPAQPNTPIEVAHFLSKGMRKHPDERFQSAKEMLDALAKIHSGYFPIQCPTTLMKRTVFSVLHFIDRSPRLAYALFVGLHGLLLLALVFKLLDWLLPT